MTSKCLNLRGMKRTLEDALARYNSLLNGEVFFSEIPDFSLTPNEHYSVKTVIPIHYKDCRVANLSVLVFQPQDGTGNTSKYQRNEVRIPEHLRLKEKPDKRVIPQDKTGVIAEYFLPLFSSTRSDGMDPIMFFNHLYELTLENKSEIIEEYILGNRNVFDNHNCQPKIQTIVGETPQGIRFGDPHAIYNVLNAGVQVAGFIEIKDKTNPLLEIMGRTAKMPYPVE